MKIRSTRRPSVLADRRIETLAAGSTARRPAAVFAAPDAPLVTFGLREHADPRFAKVAKALRTVAMAGLKSLDPRLHAMAGGALLVFDGAQALRKAATDGRLDGMEAVGLADYALRGAVRWRDAARPPILRGPDDGLRAPPAGQLPLLDDAQSAASLLLKVGKAWQEASVDIRDAPPGPAAPRAIRGAMTPLGGPDETLDILKGAVGQVHPVAAACVTLFDAFDAWTQPDRPASVPSWSGLTPASMAAPALPRRTPSAPFRFDPSTLARAVERARKEAKA